MIDLLEYHHITSTLARGATKRINHTDCPAGQDTRRRLYITRLAGSGNLVVAYCHNCCDKGVLSQNHEKYRDFGTKVTVPPTGKSFKVPVGLVYDTDKWPLDAVNWRIKKGLTEAQCQYSGMAYDASTHRVYLPQWDYLQDGHIALASGLTGYQLVRLGEDGPKYLTAQKDKSVTMSTLLLNKDDPRRTCSFGCVVEDLASGLVISERCRDTQYDAIVTVNYGTRVSPEVLYLNRMFDFGIVWLDNDGPQIARQAEKIAKVWAMLSGKPIQIETVLTDPKHVSEGDMQLAIEYHRDLAIG